MGGDPKQKLTNMVDADHVDLHRDLNNFLVKQKDEFGNHMRPQSGNTGAMIRANSTPEQRQKAMAKFYNQFKQKYPDAGKDFFEQHPNLK